MANTPSALSKVISSSDGLPIFAEASGDPSKPHVVLTHGLSLSGAIFDDFCRRTDVLRDLYIVRYDIRGHGRSGMPMTPERHISSLYADDFKRVVEAFDLRSPLLAGWSMGGIIGADIAAHLPRGTISGIFYLSATYDSTLVVTSCGGPNLQAIFVKSQSPATFVESMIDFTDSCFASPTAPEPSYHLRTLFTGIQALQPGPMRALVLMRQQDATAIQDLLRSGIPVFHIYGTEDKLVNGALADEELKKFSPAREVEVVQGGGHSLFWEHPDIVAARLIDFARKTSK